MRLVAEPRSGSTAKNEPTPSAVSKPRVSMLTADVLSGGALTLEDELEASPTLDQEFMLAASANGVMAVQAASDVQDRIKYLEVFFKSGPAANGDLTVIAAGKK